jgi:hypothetical protein
MIRVIFSSSQVDDLVHERRRNPDAGSDRTSGAIVNY